MKSRKTLAHAIPLAANERQGPSREPERRSVVAVLEALSSEHSRLDAQDFAVLDRDIDDLHARQRMLEQRARYLADASRQVAEQRDRLDELIALSPAAQLSIDAEGRICQVDHRLAILLRRQNAPMLGASFGQLVAPQSRDRYVEQLGRLFQDPIYLSQAMTMDLSLQDAISRPVAVRLQCLRLPSTLEHEDRARIEIIEQAPTRALRQSRRRDDDLAGRLLDSVHVIVVVLDEQGLIRMANRYTERLTGLKVSEMQGHSWIELFTHPREMARARRGFSPENHPNMGWSMTLDLRTRNGESRTIDWRITRLVRSKSSSQTDLLCVGTDVTQYRQLQEREQDQLRKLTHASRLTLIEQMSMQMAHELNQPLTAVASYRHLLDRQLQASAPDLDRVRELSRRIAAQSQRSGRIVRRVRRLAKRRTPELQLMNLNDAVIAALSLFDIDITNAAVQLDVNLQAELPSIYADRILIEQLIANLVRNSLDAMIDVPKNQRHIRVSTACAGKAVAMLVEDSGPGMLASTLARAFEGFYTTKPDGLGLGLALARNFVELHNGRLSGEKFSDGDGHEGMRFRVHLPIHQAGAGEQV